MHAWIVVVATLSIAGFQNESVIVTSEKLTGCSLRDGVWALMAKVTSSRNGTDRIGQDLSWPRYSENRRTIVCTEPSLITSATCNLASSPFSAFPITTIFCFDEWSSLRKATLWCRWDRGLSG